MSISGAPAFGTGNPSISWWVALDPRPSVRTSWPRTVGLQLGSAMLSVSQPPRRSTGSLRPLQRRERGAALQYVSVQATLLPRKLQMTAPCCRTAHAPDMRTATLIGQNKHPFAAVDDVLHRSGLAA